MYEGNHSCHARSLFNERGIFDWAHLRLTCFAHDTARVGTGQLILSTRQYSPFQYAKCWIRASVRALEGVFGVRSVHDENGSVNGEPVTVRNSSRQATLDS